MYIPKHFREDDLEKLQQFMRDYPFATIVTRQDDSLVASHVPLILEPGQGPYGTLIGHLALGNSQWRTFDGSREALVIFQQPHAHVSASWYEEPAKNVPTWNYAVVHVYGAARTLNDEELLRALAMLTGRIEANIEQPWIFDPANESTRRLLPGIVGFAIAISRLEGKYKLSQNRSIVDQKRVVEKLSNSIDTEANSIAELMRARLEKNKNSVQ